MTAIHLENLAKNFGAFAALKTMDLEIRNGEFMALLGPSGCGKSTTMNMIAGMEQPSGGRILFDGRDMAAVPMERRGVGFVFQNYAIFTHMTVRQNLAYGLKMRRTTAAELSRRVSAIAEFLQLAPLLDRPAAGLSVNILQRLAIGRSAVLEPAIFLLDEPLSNVDAAFRAVMRTELKHLQRQFRQTMVYVTHDQLEAMTMADRIAVMDHGVLQQVGTPLDVYNRPANLFVARFIGSPGMNLVPGTVAEGARGPAVDLGAWGMTAPLTDGRAAALSRTGKSEVVLGIRPEELILSSEGPGLRGTVSFVERIGARTIVHLAAADATMRAVADNSVPVTIGDRVTVTPSPKSIRLFDPASGRAIEEP
jgi:multiple sugar transport system ATP-binding protein